MSRAETMSEATWHDVECGGYTADLPLWEELGDAIATEEPILELGCGTGRVTMHLALRGTRRVIGLDQDRELIGVLQEKSRGTRGEGEHRDARDFELPAIEFGLVLAPMQLIQLLPGREDRISCLRCVQASMRPGARAAFAIVEDLPPASPEGAAPPLPDVGQVEGWVYSSLPQEPEAGQEAIVLRRLRQAVDPGGEMSEELNETRLCMLSAKALEDEGREAGLRPAGRREIPATEAHVGSAVVLLEKGT